MVSCTRFVSLLAALAISTAPAVAITRASAADRPPRTTEPQTVRHGRDILALDRDWQYLWDPNDQGELLGWQSTVPAQAVTAHVPSLLPPPALKEAVPIAWCYIRFSTPASWVGQTVRIQFAAVLSAASVWVNGVKAGDHTGGYTPFTLDITKLVRQVDSNLIAVRVFGAQRSRIGIWQGVRVIAHDEGYLSAVYPITNRFGELSCATSIYNKSDKTGDATLSVQISSAQPSQEKPRESHQELHITPGENVTTLLASVRGKALHVWEPGSPYLYIAEFKLAQGQDVLDSLTSTIGFRDIGIGGGSLTLNGQPVAASSAWFDPPVTEVSNGQSDAETMRSAMRRLKAQGVNTLYVTAAPPALLDIADQEGMLIVEGASSTDLVQIVKRDISHPSIVAWNILTGAPDLVRQIRSLDPSRILVSAKSRSPSMWAPGADAPSTDRVPGGLLPVTAHAARKVQDSSAVLKSG